MVDSQDNSFAAFADALMGTELLTIDDKEELKKKLAEGNFAAATKLGRLYREEKNYVESLHYYTISAERGDADSMMNAAEMAMRARFNSAGSKSEKLEFQNQAIHFWEMASTQNRLDAQFKLGMLYLSKDFISTELFSRKKNEKKGVEYLLNASKKSHIKAQYGLSLCYRDGTGVQKSIHDEIFWLRCAAINGNQDAINDLNSLSRSPASGALSSMLKDIDKEIRAHKEYIKIYYMTQEIRKSKELNKE